MKKDKNSKVSEYTEIINFLKQESNSYIQNEKKAEEVNNENHRVAKEIEIICKEEDEINKIKELISKREENLQKKKEKQEINKYFDEGFLKKTKKVINAKKIIEDKAYDWIVAEEMERIEGEVKEWYADRLTEIDKKRDNQVEK